MENKETLEEAAENNLTYWKGFSNIGLPNTINADRIKKSFMAGAKWQQEQDKNKYSEEEVENIIQKLMYDVHCGDICEGDKIIDFKISPRKWFKQFKNK